MVVKHLNTRAGRWYRAGPASRFPWPTRTPWTLNSRRRRPPMAIDGSLVERAINRGNNRADVFAGDADHKAILADDRGSSDPTHGLGRPAPAAGVVGPGPASRRVAGAVAAPGGVGALGD